MKIYIANEVQGYSIYSGDFIVSAVSALAYYKAEYGLECIEDEVEINILLRWTDYRLTYSQFVEVGKIAKRYSYEENAYDEIERYLECNAEVIE